MNKLPWFTHDHDAHQDTWIRGAVRKQGHVAGWLWWVILELYHKHGVGDWLKIDINDVAKAAMTSNSVVIRVLSHLGPESGLRYQLTLDSGPNSVECQLPTEARVSWVLDGTQLELKIPKFRERQANLKSKTISKPFQNHHTVEREVDREREEQTTNKLTDTPKAKRPAFSPPKIEEVKAYCLERGKGVDPDSWMSHYESNGWRVGKNPMKDWKAAVRTWEHNKFGKSVSSDRFPGADPVWNTK